MTFNIGRKKLKFTDNRLNVVKSHKVDVLSSQRKLDLFGSSRLISGSMKAGTERFKAHGLSGGKSLPGGRSLSGGHRTLTSLMDTSLTREKGTRIKERLKMYAHERHDEEALKEGKPAREDDEYGIMRYDSDWRDTMMSRKKIRRPK